MGMSRTHFNSHHVAKADAALAMAIAVANQQKIDKANNAAMNQTDDMLNVQHLRWQNTVNSARTALFLAGQLYDEVMAAQVKPSVFDAVFRSLLTGLALFNPELGMFANILQLGSENEKEQRQERAKRIMGGVDLLKEAIKEGMEANEAGEKIESHETTLKAKSKIIQETIEDLSETSDFFTTAFSACKKQLAKLTKAATGPISATALANVERAWYALVGGPAKPYRHGMDTELARLMLYDMMREYCRQNVRLLLQFGSGIKIPISKAKANQMIASGDGSNIEFEGLDPAKREEMYDKFEDITNWGNRPEITKATGGWKALINNWDFAS